MQTISRSPGRSGLLNWARAIAITLVLLRHGYTSQMELPSVVQWPAFAENLALNGWLGVDLFFVLSGFLLSHKLLIWDRSTRDGRFVLDFWRRRALRILPAYLVVVVSVWGVLEYGTGGQLAAGSLQLLIHLTFLQDYFGSEVLVTTWSLATEVKFYLLLPLLVIASFRISSPGPFGILLLSVSVMVLAIRLIQCWVLTPGTYPEFFWGVRAPFHNALDGLLLGVAAGYIFHANPGWLRRLSLATGNAILAALLLAAAVLLVSFNWLEASFLLSSAVIWMASAIWFGIVLVGVSMERQRGRTAKDARLVSWVATISYSLYLVHYPVLYPAKYIAVTVSTDPVIQQATLWISFVVGSLAFAWLLHKFVEKPFMQRSSVEPGVAVLGAARG